MVLVAATGSDEWDAPKSTLTWAAGRCGCRLRSRAKLTAAELGALHSQEVELFVFAAESSAAEEPVERGWAQGPHVAHGVAPACLRQALRPAEQVPGASRLAARVTARWAQPNSRFAPVTVGQAALGGVEAELLPGALLHLARPPATGNPR